MLSPLLPAHNAAPRRVTLTGMSRGLDRKRRQGNPDEVVD